LRISFAAIFLSGLCAVPVAATSIAAIRAHDPQHARPAIERLVAAIDSNDMERLQRSGILPFVYTDALGMVEFDEQQAFLASMNGSDGREDRAPIKIIDFRPLISHKFHPVYLVTLEREVWKLKDYETDGMLMPQEIDRPHWETDWTSWLITFRGSDISSIREADDLWLATRPADQP
jgi:hypothetical protein